MKELALVIDPDIKRRASITFLLNHAGIFCDPFETIGEFMQSWPKAGVVLVSDADKAVARLTEELAARHTWLPLLAYAAEADPCRVVEAVLDGAVGYALWPGSGDALVRAVQDCAARSESMPAGGSRNAIARARIAVLSERELQILAGIVEGLSNRKIASHLCISPRTVELHRANMIDKLKARSSADAIRLAIEASIPAFHSTHRAEDTRCHTDA